MPTYILFYGGDTLNAVIIKLSYKNLTTLLFVLEIVFCAFLGNKYIKVSLYFFGSTPLSNFVIGTVYAETIPFFDEEVSV